MYFRPWLLISGIFALLIITIFMSILWLNDGQFIYSIDDAYIHLALAEHIADGHYGINPHEYSAPSSSILWPFILSALSFLPDFSWAPLLINIPCTYITLYIIYKSLILTIPSTQLKTARPFNLLLLISIFLFGLPNLIFIGMEHALQVLCSAATAYGILLAHTQQKVPAWFILAIIISPLVRYENIGISFAAIFYLFFTRRYTIAIFLAIICTILVSSFSLFLLSLDLTFLPSSVLVKNSLVGFFLEIENPFLEKMIQVLSNILFPKGLILILLVYFAKKRIATNNDRVLFWAIVSAVTLNCFSSMTYVARYFPYICIFILLISTYFYRHDLIKLLRVTQEKRSKRKFLLLSILLFILTLDNIVNTLTTPIAANNIYEQQYQMAQFTHNVYKKPVAINDLGLVSFNNQHYVLDLIGLASHEAYLLRNEHEKNGYQYLKLIIERNPIPIQLAIIYTPWFTAIPPNWELIASLHISRANVSTAFPQVDFYFIPGNAQDKQTLIQQLETFKNSLPDNVRLKFY